MFLVRLLVFIVFNVYMPLHASCNRLHKLALLHNLDTSKKKDVKTIFSSPAPKTSFDRLQAWWVCCDTECSVKCEVDRISGSQGRSKQHFYLIVFISHEHV